MKMKATRKAMGIPTGIAVSTLISLIISLGGAAVCAWLVSSEKIGECSIGYAAMFVVMLASAAGAWFNTYMIQRHRLQMCLLSGTCYFLSLLAMTALFFGGQYQGLGAMAIVILCGCAVIAFFPTKKGQLKLKKKRSYR